MPKYGGKQNFSFLSIPGFKSKERREKEEIRRREKVNVYNGQYIRLNQNCEISSVIFHKY